MGMTSHRIALCEKSGTGRGILLQILHSVISNISVNVTVWIHFHKPEADLDAVLPAHKRTVRDGNVIMRIGDFREREALPVQISYLI